MGAVGSFVGLGSMDLTPFGVVTRSGTATKRPFGLFEAEDAGR